MTRKALDFFLSLRTALWLLLALLCLLLYGSVIMPLREEFQSMSFVPLLYWMKGNRFALSWWLWAAVGVLALLTANTIFCSIQSVVKKRGARHWLLVLSPQVMHLGFLFILFAHLLSSYGSAKGIADVYKGSALQLPNGLTVVFDDVRAGLDPSGYMADWSADIRYFRAGGEIARDVIRPNRPSFREGYGLYIKTVRPGPYPVALIEASREPGAPWALVGGILFLAGMMTLLIFKMRTEEAIGL